MTLSTTTASSRGSNGGGGGGGGGVNTSEDRIVRVRAIRACISCRNRKIRCDQVRPVCGSCNRGNILCEYPSQARRPPRPRQPDAVLVQRLARLESVIEELSAGKRQEEERVRSESVASTSQFSGSEYPMSPTPSSLGDIEAGVGRLLVSRDGKSRYVGPNFWALLSGEAADLNSLLHETQEEDEPPDPEQDPMPGLSSFFFRPSNVHEDLSFFHLQLEFSHILYQRYVFAVEPLVRVLHKPTFEKQMLRFHRNELAGLTTGFEAMLFTIYLAALTSMTKDEVMHIFGVDQKTMCARYMVAVEHALWNAHFLQSEELMPLQAFVLFNICLRGGSDTRTSWTLIGTAVRIAHSLGLHRDGSLFNMSPFETEMRRRVWYQICILDVRSAEDHGCDPYITTKSFDTLVPLNINDEDLSDDPDAPPPVPRCEWTEMTFTLIRFEVLDLFWVLFRHDPGAAKCPRYLRSRPTVEEKEEKIETVRRAVQEKYLKFAASTGAGAALQKVSIVLLQLMMGKALISLYHPLRHTQNGDLLSPDMKQKLFVTGITNLEYSCSFFGESKNKDTHQWHWFFQKHGQHHALALVLLELNERPTNDDNFNRAWAAVDAYFEKETWSHGKQQQEEDTWRPLAKLRDKAMRRKTEARFTGNGGTAMATAAVPGVPGAGVGLDTVTLEDSPIDWNEWDDMFRYVKMDFE